jgi:hypothetical protein
MGQDDSATSVPLAGERHDYFHCFASFIAAETRLFCARANPELTTIKKWASKNIRRAGVITMTV